MNKITKPLNQSVAQKGDLIINGTDITLSEDLTIKGNLTILDAEIDLAGYNLTVEGSVYQEDGILYINSGNVDVYGDYLIEKLCSYSTGRLQIVN